MKHYDVLIIGAGTAGLSAAKEAARHTDNFSIIESGSAGTLCARAGCMPSKALIAATRHYHARKKLADYGIHGAENISADIPEILRHVRTLRDHFVGGVKEGMQRYEIIEGKARLQDTNIVEVNGEAYKADAIIICTGSVPRIPDIFMPHKNNIITTDTLFEQEALPKSLAIIGTGNVGTEMGQALARLGIKVTLVGRSENIAGITDPDIHQEAQKILGEDIELRFNTPIQSVEKNERGFCIHSGVNRITVDNILVSAGRVPNIKDLGLEELAIEMDERGVPVYDPDTLKVKEQPIYIAGDANADRAILHEAADEGKLAVQHALGIADSFSRRVPLGITFTSPPIIKVGQDYAEVKYSDPLIGEVSYQEQGRAKIEQENHGKARLYAARDGTLLGAEMIAPEADHVAHLLALAIQEKLSVSSILSMPFYHPVLEEGLRTALGSIQKELKQQEVAVNDII